MRTGGGDFDDLPVQPLDQRPVFRFGVADDNVVVGDEIHIGDLTLGGKGFSGTGGAKNQAVRVFEELSVHHDEVVGQRVQPAVERLAAVLVKLLRRKRHEDITESLLPEKAIHLSRNTMPPGSNCYRLRHRKGCLVWKPLNLQRTFFLENLVLPEKKFLKTSPPY